MPNPRRFDRDEAGERAAQKAVFGNRRAKLSYSLYLVHPVVYGALGDAFVERGPPATAGNVGTLMMVSVGTAFACATMLYVFVERPIMERR